MKSNIRLLFNLIYHHLRYGKNLPLGLHTLNDFQLDENDNLIVQMDDKRYIIRIEEMQEQKT